MYVLSLALADNSTLKCTNTHTLTYTLTDRAKKEGGREERRIYSHLSWRFCGVKVVPGTLLITQAVLFYSRDAQPSHHSISFSNKHV